MNNTFQRFVNRFHKKNYSYEELRAVYNYDKTLHEKIGNCKAHLITDREVKDAVEKYRDKKFTKYGDDVYIREQTKEQTTVKPVTKKDIYEWYREMIPKSCENDSSSDSNESDNNSHHQPRNSNMYLKKIEKLQGRIDELEREAANVNLKEANLCMQLMGVDRKSRKSIYDSINSINAQLKNLSQFVFTEFESKRQHVELERLTTSMVPGASTVDMITQLNDDLVANIETYKSLTERVNQVVKPHVDILQAEFAATMKTSDGIRENTTTFLRKSFEIAEMILKEIESKILRDSFKKKKLSLSMKDNAPMYCPGVEKEFEIIFEQINTILVDGISTRPQVIGDHLEICDCQFDVIHNESSTANCFIRGRLRIYIDARLVLNMLTDVNWRPPVTLYENSAVGEIGALCFSLLSHRVLYLLRYLLHSFTHIFAAINPRLLNACFDHPKNIIFEEISLFFEPRRLFQP